MQSISFLKPLTTFTTSQPSYIIKLQPIIQIFSLHAPILILNYTSEGRVTFYIQQLHSASGWEISQLFDVSYCDQCAPLLLWWNLCGLGSPGMCLDSFPSLNLSTLKCFQVAGNPPCLANPNRPKVTLPWSCKGLRCEHQLLCWATPSSHTWSRGTDAHNEDSDDQEMVGLFRVLLFFGASVLILGCHWELGPICLFTAQGLSYMKWWTMSAYETCD